MAAGLPPATGEYRKSRFGIVISREVSAVGDDVTLTPGRSALWDGRFQVTLAGRAGKPLRVTALGTDGWTEIRGKIDPSTADAIPAGARVTLPALCDKSGIVAVPHLGFRRAGAKVSAISTVFSPKIGLSG